MEFAMTLVYERKHTPGFGGGKFERVRDADIPAPTEPGELANYEADIASAQSSTPAPAGSTAFSWRPFGGLSSS
jgi:hypothetical protein